ncbi:MAG: glycosyl transferase 2 family protein [Herminiimonas sp.]|nr:glycosyl transferase 2 family protein [Herminiimonas sp.]
MDDTEASPVRKRSSHANVARDAGDAEGGSTMTDALPAATATCIDTSLTVIVLSYNRAAELWRTLTKMLCLPEQPSIIVVDNASNDGSADMVANRFPQVGLIRLERNLGAYARNIGVAAAATPYVAFCDDDTWWAEGSLATVVGVFNEHPDVAVLNAHVRVGPEQRDDPTCLRMAASPILLPDLPGPALFGFLAGASAMRRDAFLEVGGYEEKFFIGGEEALLAIDLLARGWNIVYLPELTVHHYPSPQRDSRARHHNLARNGWWLLWLRFPCATACRESLHMLPRAYRQGVLHTALPSALLGFVWAMRNRAPMPPEVVSMFESS